MGGRHAKPLELHLFDKKSRLSKKQIENRISSEIKLGEKGFICPENVQTNPMAYKIWIWLVQLYENFIFATSADVKTMANYCITQSDYDLECDPEKRLKYLPSLNTLTGKLLLDPLSRIKTIPTKKKEEKEEDEHSKKLKELFGE
jgi:phage terminase small subunit